MATYTLHRGSPSQLIITAELGEDETLSFDELVSAFEQVINFTPTSAALKQIMTACEVAFERVTGVEIPF